jgi:hypothetical protein
MRLGSILPENDYDGDWIVYRHLKYGISGAFSNSHEDGKMN